ncbi:MAG: hypothetical protein PF450_16995, partial [Bacteroidales bacterium]|nr:hypothetical protein [Bacteroidales bacterium]
AYAVLAMIESYKEDGVSNVDETTVDSDLRDALEEFAEKRVDSVLEWDGGTNYTTVTLVSIYGYQFVAYNLTGNFNKNPIDNPLYWYKIPKSDTLLDQHFSGEPSCGGFSGLSNRAGATYYQNILFGKYRFGVAGNSFYNFFMIHLDGTIVTGDVTLEGILKPGIAGEYWNIDLIAPDVVGTRTLLDVGEYVATPQSDGGENDVLGGLQDDRFQGFNISVISTGQASGTSPLQRTGQFNSEATTIPIDFVDDGTSGTPRTGLTTRPKELTVGCSYIIVMIAV